jgi:hypothetical protein
MSYKVQENARRIRPNQWDVSKKNFFGRCRVLAAADGADCNALFLGLLQAWWKWVIRSSVLRNCSRMELHWIGPTAI